MNVRYLLLSFVLLVACGTESGDTPADTGPSDTPGSQEVSAEVAPFESVAEPEDVVEFVAPETVDVAAEEAFVPCAPGEGCFLDPCTENEDCQSGFCVDHLGEGVCTVGCQADCPPGWDCRALGGGPDVVFVCISAMTNLCRPCATANDCKAPGGAEDVCVDYGPEGSFCGGACATDDDCPWGFACSDGVTVSGVSTLQCMAEAGVCPCTGKSIALGLSTPCSRTNEFGTCDGLRVCSEEGLTDCDAAVPAAESCNGLDDDCDGQVDEPAEVEGNLVNLCDDQNPCTVDKCLGETGCENEALDEGECMDGNPCTIADHCEAGVCAGSPVDCDDENPCTDDSCDESGGCVFEPNTATCDDGDPCTVADQCAGGECTGFAVACDCHEDADCVVLEDGDLCNGTLVCDTTKLPHLCVVDPDTLVACPVPTGPDAPCLVPSCDPESGLCGTTSAPDGTPCNDGNPCTVNDACSAGSCTGGLPANCSDGNPCTDDPCDPEEGCLNVANEAPCDDGNACTLGDHCAAGICTYDEELVCDDGDVCTTDTCSPQGGCSYALNSAPCNDGNVCTTGDHCHLGECINSGTLSCNDANPCTDDSCKPASGCAFTPNAAPCDDNNACTTDDVCTEGQCQGGVGVDCDDGNPCTFDTCDISAGCVHSDLVAPCDDGNACTVGDQCGGGECLSGPVPDCDDGNSCTDDSCDPQVGCVNTPNALPCDDNSVCTVADTCQDGACVPGAPLNCDDEVGCTVDTCHAVEGCQHTPDDDVCDDGNECTVGKCMDGQGCEQAALPDLTPCGQDGWKCLDGVCTEKQPCEGGWAYGGRCWYEGPIMSDGNCPTCDEICAGHGGCHEPSLVTNGLDQSCTACKATACPGCGCQDGIGNVAAHEAAPMHNGSICEYTDHPNYPPICGSHHCNYSVWGRRRLCACNETP